MLVVLFLPRGLAGLTRDLVDWLPIGKAKRPVDETEAATEPRHPNAPAAPAE